MATKEEVKQRLDAAETDTRLALDNVLVFGVCLDSCIRRAYEWRAKEYAFLRTQLDTLETQESIDAFEECLREVETSPLGKVVT